MYTPRHAFGTIAGQAQSAPLMSQPEPARHLRPIVAVTNTDLPAGEQFNAWRDQCGSVVEMLAPVGTRSGYPAACTTWKLGPFALSTVSAPAATYRRTRAQVRRDALDHWVVNVARRGTYTMRTDRGEFTAPAGAPFIFTFADAFEGERTDIDWLCLFVPRETFPELGPMIDRSRNRPLDGGMGLLLCHYLTALQGEIAAMTEPEVPRLVAATRAMVAACIAPSSQTREAAETYLHEARLERVRHVIRQNLRSPTLTPKRICKLVGVSRSQLYRLFEPIGGVATYIQQARLREAYRALSDADNRRDIHEVADDLGFFDASTFSRAFRREFGCTPSDVRIGAMSGARTSPVRLAPALVANAPSFASLLRTL